MMFILLNIILFVTLIFFIVKYPYYKFSIFTSRKVVFVLILAIYSYIIMNYLDEYAEQSLYVMLVYLICAIIIQIYHKVLKHESGRNK